MKRLLSTCCFLLLFLLCRNSSQAQDVKTINPPATKTVEQMSREYEEWTKYKDDWPNLNRYRDSNQKVGLPKPGEDRVVFMGNSITEGWLKISPDFFEGRPYIDRGISGQTTPQMLIRFRADVINLKPKMVVILGGTNDIAGNTGPSTLGMIEDNIASMAELGKFNGIKVILASVLPVYDYPWRPGLEPAEKIAALNNWVEAYAARHGMIYLDYYSSLADERKGMKSAYSEDGVHPNKAGYQVMEGLAEKAISKALNRQ